VMMLLATSMALTKRGLHEIFIGRLLSSVHIPLSIFLFMRVNCYLPGEVDERKTENFFPTFYLHE